MKYDWLRLKDEFVRGKWFSVSEFLRVKNIPNNSYSRKKTTGWKDVKTKFVTEIVIRTQEKSVDTESDIRFRQQQLAKQLQYKGESKLEELSVDSIGEARKLITEGLREEREALGININHNNTQINLAITGSSEIDKMVEGMGYEQILELLAEVRREKQKRETSKLQGNQNV